MKSVLVSLDGRVDLAQRIIDEINNLNVKKKVTLDPINSQKFSDGELCVDFTNSIRGKRVYILTSPVNSDEIIKLNFAIDAAKRAAAKEIIAILPFFPYQRSDKKDQSRGAIAAKVMAEMLENRGSTGIITFDLHADQIQGFFNIPVTHLEGKNVFSDYIASIYNEETVLCGPDAGSGKRVKRMKDQLLKYHNIVINYVMMDKTRKEANVIGDMVIIGDVVGKHVIILDDMVDTAGTLCTAANVLIENGALSVRAIISHGICSGPALARIEKSNLTELVISDSLPKPIDYNGMYGNNKINVISMAHQIGVAMSAINNKASYETLKKERY
jgi:ribose-phosphate pyrophosphokinase|tara:strand:+ start:4358 stop:5344 length:987 start_codon:yes stop_codon:yes gene_type:complete